MDKPGTPLQIDEQTPKATDEAAKSAKSSQALPSLKKSKLQSLPSLTKPSSKSLLPSLTKLSPKSSQSNAALPSAVKTSDAQSQPMEAPSQADAQSQPMEATNQADAQSQPMEAPSQADAQSQPMEATNQADAQSQPMGVTRSQPIGVTRSQPIGVSKSQPIGVSKSQPIGVSKSQPIGVSKSQPIGVSKSQPGEDTERPSESSSQEIVSAEANVRESQDSGEANAHAVKTNIKITGSSLPEGLIIDDRYKILGIIGEGGFATVYYAHDLTIDREVAIKVMDLKKGVSDNYVKRFFREAKAAAKIHHNNVVAIYDFGHIEATGQPFITMELLRGHTLNDELSKKGPLTPRRAFRLFRPVIEALSFGHQLGIIHKDLKPENLYIVDPDGPRETMKVLDFGVARLQSEATKLTNDGQILGTPRYLAPEYIQSQAVSPAIDVYQMALIMSEALCGTPAVSGEFYQVMMLHCSGQLRISPFLLEGEVGQVFMKALAVKPQERYADCEAFGQALDSIASYFESDEPAPKLPLDTSAPIPVDPLIPKGPIPLKQNARGNQNEMNPGQPPADMQGIPIAMLQGGYPEEPAQANNKSLIVVAVILVVVAIALFIIMMNVFGSKDQDESSQPAAEEAETTVKFTFETTPSGASVLRNDIHLVCHPTPCKAEFKTSDLTLSQLIVFKLDGYEDAKYELKGTTYEETNGTIYVNLTELPKAPETLEFYITYEPENATVTDLETDEEVCQSSPCAYVFDLDRGNVELRFEAAGYHPKTENLFKRRFEESGGSLNVVLEKQSKGSRSAKANGNLGDPDVLCRKAAKAKVMGKVCESVHLYKNAKKAGITDAVCKRNAENTIAEYGHKCK